VRARHLLVPLLFLSPLAACSGDDIIDDLTGPTGLDVRGTYDVLGWFTATEVASGISGFYTCDASVTVSSQTGTVFSGSWTIFLSGDCPGEFVGTMTGTVEDSDGGDITVSFLIPGRDAAVQAISGCQITSGDDEFSGVIDPDTGFLDVESVYTANCPKDGGMAPYEFSIRFATE